MKFEIFSTKDKLDIESGEIFIVLQDLGLWLLVQSEKTGEIGKVPENFTSPGRFKICNLFFCNVLFFASNILY